MEPQTGMRQRVLAAIRAGKESATEFDGYASYRGEWHALAWGLFAGFLTGYTGDPVFLFSAIGWLFSRNLDSRVPKYIKETLRRELQSEVLYVIGHVPVGLILGAIVARLLGVL